MIEKYDYVRTLVETDNIPKGSLGIVDSIIGYGCMVTILDSEGLSQHRAYYCFDWLKKIFFVSRSSHPISSKNLDEELFFYHITSAENIASIIEKGLLNINGKNSQSVGHKRKSILGFSKEEDFLSTYNLVFNYEELKDTKLELLRFKTTYRQLHTSIANLEKPWYWITHRISPKNIEFLKLRLPSELFSEFYEIYGNRYSEVVKYFNECEHKWYPLLEYEIENEKRRGIL